MRNFGIMSGRSALGGTSDRPSANSADTTRADSISDLELRSKHLFFFVFLFPIVFVGGLVVGYAAFAPEPVQYELRVEAYRLKGH